MSNQTNTLPPVRNPPSAVGAPPSNVPVIRTGTATLDFGSGQYKDTATLFVADPLVGNSTRLVGTVSMPNTRDLDECEMETFTLMLTPVMGSGFWITMSNGQSGGAHGQYTVQYTEIG